MSENTPYKSEGETVYATDDTRQVPEPKYRNEKWLRHQYNDLKKSARQIANEYDYGSTTINEWLDRHNIEKREHGKQVSISKRRSGVYNNKDWLASQYHGLGLTIQEMAEKIDVDRLTIIRAMDKYGIDRRTAAESNRKTGPWDGEDWLHEQYIEKGKSTTQIADEYDVSSNLIRERLLEHGIKLRNSGVKGEWWHEDKDYTSREWLEKEYIAKERPVTELAEECNVSDDTVSYWLEKFDIDRRDDGPRWHEINGIPKRKNTSGGVKSKDGNIELNLSFQDSSPGVEYWVPYRDKDWLEEKYHGEGMTITGMAEEIGVASATISNWMDKLNVEKRE